MNARLLGLGQVGAWIIAIFSGVWLLSQGNILGPVFTLLLACSIHGVLGVFLKIDQYLDRLNNMPVQLPVLTQTTVSTDKNPLLANQIKNEIPKRRPLDERDLERLEKTQKNSAH